MPLFSAENPYPNPASEVAGFSFKLHSRSLVSLSLVDLQGGVRAKIIDREWRGPGKFPEKIEPARFGLAPGAYFLVLEVDGAFVRRKVLFMRGE